jgi:hypothetical protein
MGWQPPEEVLGCDWRRRRAVSTSSPRASSHAKDGGWKHVEKLGTMRCMEVFVRPVASMRLNFVIHGEICKAALDASNVVVEWLVREVIRDARCAPLLSSHTQRTWLATTAHARHLRCSYDRLLRSDRRFLCARQRSAAHNTHDLFPPLANRSDQKALSADLLDQKALCHCRQKSPSMAFSWKMQKKIVSHATSAHPGRRKRQP